MKKFIAALCAIMLSLPIAPALAAYTQADIYTSIDSGTAWMEKNAAPLKRPESAASDYYIMALARANKPYDYAAYAKYIGSRTPSTNNDGQRLIMVSTACKTVLADNFVKMYTYSDMPETASELAGAVLALDCGGYEVNGNGITKNHMLAALLEMQQTNGSFNNDVFTTAKAVLALAPYKNSQFKVNGEHENAVYTYDTSAAIKNAAQYLSISMDADSGFKTINNTAYVIMALDAIGMDADNDSSFAYNGLSPVSWIKNRQQSDGSFNSSADDTALALCAMVSHLRAMQGKSSFFDFTSHDATDPVADGSVVNHSGDGAKENASSSDGGSDTIELGTPPPAREPEHSETKAEQYGPLPFVGPVKQDDDNGDAAATEAAKEPETDTDGGKTGLIVLFTILCVLAAAGGVFVFIYHKYPSVIELVPGKVKACANSFKNAVKRLLDKLKLK